MNVLYKFKTGHPVKVVIIILTRLWSQEPNKQSYSYDKTKKQKIFNSISDEVFGTPITDRRQTFPTPRYVWK